MAASFKADDRRASQWYIDYMKAPAAWEILEANVPSLTPAKVAIIDTGASLDHLDLSNVVNREQSIEVIHGEDSDLSSWKWQPLRGDGYVNGSAGSRSSQATARMFRVLWRQKLAMVASWGSSAAELRL